MEGDMPDLYDSDFYAWTQQQAAAIRAGNWDAIERERLAEEVEDLYKEGSHELWQLLNELMPNIDLTIAEMQSLCELLMSHQECLESYADWDEELGQKIEKELNLIDDILPKIASQIPYVT
jgi:hypothetical protein